MNARRIIVYYHDTCPTSVKLIDLLEKKNLLDLVELINVKDRPFLAISKGILSVPAIEIDGDIIDFGPIDFDYVINRIKGVEGDLKHGDKLRGLKITILDNLFLSLNLYLHEDIDVLIEYDLIRKRLDLDGKNISEIKEKLGLRREEFYKSMEEKLLKVIAINLLREIKWLDNTDLERDKVLSKYGIEFLAHWIVARGSIARIGLIVPDEKFKVRSKAAKLYEFIRDNWDYLIQKI